MDGYGWGPILAVGLLLALAAAASAGSGVPQDLDPPISEALGLLLGDELPNGTENIPVIVVFEEGSDKVVPDLEVKHSYRTINGVSGRANASILQRLAEDPQVLGVYPDGTVAAAQPENATQDLRNFCATVPSG
jgi:hypothetical protein